VPLATSDFVCSLLEKAPEHRPQSWEDVTRALKKVSRGRRILRTTGSRGRHDRAALGTASAAARPRASSLSRLLTLLILLLGLTTALLVLQLKRRQTASPAEIILPTPAPLPGPDRATQPDSAQAAADSEWATLQPTLKDAPTARARVEQLETFRAAHGNYLRPEFHDAMAQARREADRDKAPALERPEPESALDAPLAPAATPPAPQPPADPFPPEPEGRAREKPVDNDAVRKPGKQAPK
jgi:hypothetical protein